LKTPPQIRATDPLYRTQGVFRPSGSTENWAIAFGKAPPRRPARRLLAGCQALGLSGQFTLGEIDRLSTPLALVLAVEFVGKDFGCGAALGTFAGKGFQIAKIFIAGAMLGCRHGSSLIVVSSLCRVAAPDLGKVQAIFLAMSRP